MKKLNIAIVCDSITHLTAGSIISTLRFAEGLKKKGHKIIFIAAKDKEKREISFHNGFKIYRFFSFPLPGSKGQYLLSFPRVKKIKQILSEEEIDLIHIIDPTISARLCIKAAKSLGIKIIAHSHTQPENMCLQLPKIVQSEKMNNFVYKYMINLYKKVDAVICPSKFAKKALKKFDKKLEPYVVSNGVNLSKFKLNGGKFKNKHSSKKKTILYVGRLHMEKSVHTLIEAMPYILKELKNTRLEIVGTGHLREDLEKLAGKLGVSENITFKGKVSEKNLLEEYNECDLFVLPSIAELEGMVVLEAMACGKPILISNSKLSASSDFVNGNGLIFKLQDPKDLAKKAIIILNNEKMIKKMSAESCKQAQAYDINKSVDKLEKIYSEVLNLH
jgi:glycosyltransferase involved in cell wall biosynthesis